MMIDATQLIQDLHRLAEFNDTPNDAGITRVAYSRMELLARDWLDEQCRAAGMQVRRDPAGNSIARLGGAGAAIAIGSHTDTVPNGGKYDGALGVLAALAAVRALQKHKHVLNHPLELINFMAEEATMSGGTTGSQMMSGAFNVAQFEQTAWDGKRVGEHYAAAGLVAGDWHKAIRMPNEFLAFIELHIEQGDALIHAQKNVGVVEGIVGIRRYKAVFLGEANHAGTTPMHTRKDALVYAAPFVQTVRDVAVAHGITATVGKLDVKPNAPNVIAGEVEMIVELRALRPERMDAVVDELRARAIQQNGTLTQTVNKPPALSDAHLLRAIERACDSLQLRHMRMPSGAFHDCASMAALCPAAMIFVPSVGGISHNAKEFTRDEDCANGARVLLETVLQVDADIRLPHDST